MDQWLFRPWLIVDALQMGFKPNIALLVHSLYLHNWWRTSGTFMVWLNQSFLHRAWLTTHGSKSGTRSLLNMVDDACTAVWTNYLEAPRCVIRPWVNIFLYMLTHVYTPLTSHPPVWPSQMEVSQKIRINTCMVTMHVFTIRWLCQCQILKTDTSLHQKGYKLKARNGQS